MTDYSIRLNYFRLNFVKFAKWNVKKNTLKLRLQKHNSNPFSLLPSNKLFKGAKNRLFSLKKSLKK